MPCFSNSILVYVSLLSTQYLARAANELQLLANLKRDYPDWKPNAILDVGANAGNWAKGARDLFPDDKIMMYEATPRHNQTLAEKAKEMGNADYRIAVLSEREGDKVEFFQDGNTGNSMFKERTSYYNDAKSVTRVTTKLDNSIRGSFIQAEEPVGYLKLDVQGAELVILKGATELLRRVTFVQMEISFVEYNAGGACFDEINDFMQRQGFTLYDIGEQVRGLIGSKGVGQVDVLYISALTSERWPSFMRDRSTNFCGANRFAIRSTNSYLGTTYTNTNSNRQSSKQKPESPHKVIDLTNLQGVAVATLMSFLIGYACGGKTKWDSQSIRICCCGRQKQLGAHLAGLCTPVGFVLYPLPRIIIHVQEGNSNTNPSRQNQ